MKTVCKKDSSPVNGGIEDLLRRSRWCLHYKQKIKSWDRMIEKMKEKFIPRDYQITLFRRMQNLR
jgi:hypothetical protein